MVRKCLRNFVFFFVLFLFSFPAKAQNYQVTPEQLQKLEAICQKYKANSQKQELLVNELQEQLKTERALTKNLNESLTKYETSQLIKEQEINTLKEELSKEQLNGQKKTTHIFILYAVITVLCLFIGVMIYLKIRKIF